MDFDAQPRNGKGMWVQVWVPLPDAATEPLGPTSSNMLFDDTAATIHSQPGSSPNLIPSLSNSPESLNTFPVEPSPQFSADSFQIDDFADPMLFPPLEPFDLPLDADIDFALEGFSLPSSQSAISESDAFAQYVNWSLDASSASPATTTFDSFSPTTSSAHTTPTILSIPTPTYLPAAPALPSLQPASPPLARANPTPYRCSTCSEAYPKRCELTKHKRKHTRPHRCQLCDFGSAELRGLQRHIWASHRDHAEANGVPRQITKCDYPDCIYEGRLDNVKRHMKRHEKPKAKKTRQ